jgi:hypothetical protein
MWLMSGLYLEGMIGEHDLGGFLMESLLLDWLVHGAVLNLRFCWLVRERIHVGMVLPSAKVLAGCRRRQQIDSIALGF